jgi:L,D-peptidoglycan transpeptidase YkuD (ErfK/YbiS/YcfS/YnhG family)
MDLVVTPGTGHAARLAAFGRTYRCAIGRGGVCRDKREGDGATPVGAFALRAVWFRPDRLAPPATALPHRPIAPDDGWCDDPAHPAYNRHVRLPFSASHETLWRADALYDLIVVPGHNDDPPVAGAGSAIFIHCADAAWGPTEGCVALAQDDLLGIVERLGPASRLIVTAA